MPPERCRLTRRQVLLSGLGGVGAFLAGCATSPSVPAGPTPSGSASTGSPAPSSSAPPPSSTPPPEPEPEADPLDVEPYAILDGEVEPKAKEAAVAALTAALTWRDGRSAPEDAVARVEELGSPSGAVATLPALLGDTAWSSLEITYPQYGGLVRDLTSASVMVNGFQVVPSGPDVVRKPVTLDVRLEHPRSGWQVTEILYAPDPPAAPTVSPSVQAVLATENVVLPEVCRADLLSGAIDDLVADILVELAKTWRLHVQVMSTGHPFTVFATDRQSNHTRGRAVDIWAIDDIPVIDQDRSPWEAVMRAAAELGSDEIGGPVDLDGVRGQRPYFTDHVHQDHLHIGFEPKPPN